MMINRMAAAVPSAIKIDCAYRKLESHAGQASGERLVGFVESELLRKHSARQVGR